MRIATPTDRDVFTTPNAVMTSLATPGRGSAEISAWTVRMSPGTRGPLHAIDREQIWLPLSGTLTVTADGGTREVGPGEAAILPAGEERQFSATGTEEVRVLVCMANGGRALVAGERRAVPWAE